MMQGGCIDGGFNHRWEKRCALLAGDDNGNIRKPLEIFCRVTAREGAAKEKAGIKMTSLASYGMLLAVEYDDESLDDKRYR